MTPKTPEEILRDVAEGNHVDLRDQRQTLLSRFRNRVDKWLVTLRKRGQGPSGTEWDAIVSDLDTYLDRLRRSQ